MASWHDRTPEPRPTTIWVLIALLAVFLVLNLAAQTLGWFG